MRWRYGTALAVVCHLPPTLAHCPGSGHGTGPGAAQCAPAFSWYHMLASESASRRSPLGGPHICWVQVHMLLDKLQPDMIRLDPTLFGTVVEDPASIAASATKADAVAAAAVRVRAGGRASTDTLPPSHRVTRRWYSTRRRPGQRRAHASHFDRTGSEDGRRLVVGGCVMRIVIAVPWLAVLGVGDKQEAWPEQVVASTQAKASERDRSKADGHS